MVSFAAMSTSAANWVDADSNPEKGFYAYVDTESVSTQGKYKQAFTKYINIPGEYYLVALKSFDCKSNPRRSKATYITKFDLTGNVTASSEMTGISFSPVLPESMEEGLASIVCSF